VAPPVHGDLGEPGVADEPDDRPVDVVRLLAAVDGPLGEQRAALVDHMRPGRNRHDQLAAPGVDIQRDLAARQHRVGQVDDQCAEVRGEPGAPSGHPPSRADHLAEAGGDLGVVHHPNAGVRGVVCGEVAGKRGEFAEGFRGVSGFEPFRVLRGRQPAGGQRATEHGGRAIPIGVRGAQL